MGVKPPPRSRDIHGAAREAMTPLKLAGVRGLIWRQAEFIASPQLQKAYGGDPKLPQVFAERLWIFHVKAESLHGEKPQLASMDLDSWRQLAEVWALKKKVPSKPRQHDKLRHFENKSFNAPFSDLKNRINNSNREQK